MPYARATLLALLAVLVTTDVTATPGLALKTEADIPGATLRIEVRQPVSDDKAAALVEWLQSTASQVTLAYGRFPNPSPRIVVIPSAGRSWGGGSPVPFGRVTRDGEEKIELYVNTDAAMTAFYDNWTATHEFSHLMLPYLDDRHRWISEGFASYYQNVLMSRAGRYTPERAWQKLCAGFERGRVSRPDLSPNEAALAGMRRARMKIYWSGAAVALLADVELRERSGGRESLDVALGRLQQCCLPSARTWSGPELFAKLDSLVAEPVFMPLYKRYADRPGFPDTSDALARLGIAVDGELVDLQPGAELAATRAAIARPLP